MDVNANYLIENILNFIKFWGSFLVTWMGSSENNVSSRIQNL